MTEDEKKRFDTLQEQLDSARKQAEEIRTYFLSVLGKCSHEIHMYRGLFWCFLTAAALVAILRLLAK